MMTVLMMMMVLCVNRAVGGRGVVGMMVLMIVRVIRKARPNYTK